MNETEIRVKTESMKKMRKCFVKVTTVIAILCIALLIAYNFLSVTYLKSPVGTDYEKGFAFPGWQMIFYGFGRQYIMQDHLFDPNPFTIIGMLGTMICLIVCTVSFKNGKNKSKAIKEFIMAAFLIYSAFVLGFMIIPVASTAATSGSVYDFKNQYILNSAVSFTAMPAAKLCGVAFLTAGILKALDGAFLLYQRMYVTKYSNK